jgi:hypothetical protein
MYSNAHTQRMTKSSKGGQKPGPEEMIARVKALAGKRGGRIVSRGELEDAGISRRDVLRHFSSHNALIEACGLEARNRRVALPDETLLAAMHTTFSKAGRVIGGRNFNHLNPYNQEAYKNRWRSWSGSLRAYRDWLHRHHPDCPHLAEVGQRCQ